MLFPAIPSLHYLDHNATSPLLPEVKAAMDEVMLSPLNPSSVHRMGRYAKQCLEAARHAIRHSLGTPQSTIIFTASGTEANQMALRGLPHMTILASSIEHASILSLVPVPHRLPVSKDGILDLGALEERIQSLTDPFLISVMAANNETGVIQPIEEIVRLVHAKGGLVHSDASQYYGKLPIASLASCVDLMTISAHKCGGPQGAAALMMSPCMTLNPLITGGAQENNWRAGTESMAAILGFGHLASMTDQLYDRYQQLRGLRDRLEQAVSTGPFRALLIGQTAPRLPNTSCLSLPGIRYDTQLIHFDLHHIAVSAGSACSSGKIGSSHVLKAMALEDSIAEAAIRVSLGHTTTEHDILTFVAHWQQMFERTLSVV